jgi:CAAX protease family protein
MMQSHPVLVFLIGTFALAGLAFAMMFAIPSAQSPEGMPGLPIWLIAIWSPSVMAILLALNGGYLTELLSRLVTFRGLGMSWVIVAIPLLILIAAIILSWGELSFSEFTPGLVIMLLALNLFLGPLGEELGWRGFLQPTLEARFGWLPATLIVSSVWAIWHAPLWAIASPQSEIPFQIFFVHVMAYGFLMASAQTLAPHSLVHVVLLHLFFNVTASVALLSNIADTERWYSATAFPYLACAIVVAVLVRGRLVSESSESIPIFG